MADQTNVGEGALDVLLRWARREGAAVGALAASGAGGRTLQLSSRVAPGAAAATLPLRLLLRGDGSACESPRVARALERLRAAGAPEAARVAVHLALCAAAEATGLRTRWAAYVR